MEHSLQVFQHLADNSLPLSSPYQNIQDHQLDLPLGNICQLSSPFQSNLRLVSQEIYTEQNQESQGLELGGVSLTDQLAPISLQVNSQKHQEFFIDLENILKEQYQVKQTDSIKKRICTHNHSCTICHQRVRRKSIIYRLKCKHIFHIKCLDSWKIKRNNCPLCRKYLVVQKTK